MLRDFPIAFARLRDKKTNCLLYEKEQILCLYFQDLFFERKTGIRFI